MNRVVIAGGGLAGGLAALALARRRPEVELLLIEQGETFGGNHSWSFFDTDVAPADRWLLEGIAARHWSDHDIRFPKRVRTLPIGYNTIRSAALDAALKAELRPDQYRLGTGIAAIEPTAVVLADGERLSADAVIDARGGGAAPGLTLGWQKFVGRVLRFTEPHGVTRPAIMDAAIPQYDGYRFLYRLPLSPDTMLIEDTYYSADPALDVAALRGRVDADASRFGAFAVEDEEQGVLPVVIAGELDDLWPADDAVPRLGVRGGFFHPTTSYSLPDAVANAAWLAEAQDLRAAPLAAALRQRAQRLWCDRRFFRLLNRMLFRAAEPDTRYRVLEHFYRLPPEIVARFYAARLTTLDKLRIVSGRPPVPLGRAIAAAMGKAA